MPRHDHIEHLFAGRFEAAGLQGIVAGRQGLVAFAVIVEEKDDRVEVVGNVRQQPPMDFGRGVLLLPLDIIPGQGMVGSRKTGRQANRLVEALDRLRPQRTRPFDGRTRRPRHSRVPLPPAPSCIPRSRIHPRSASSAH